MHELNKKNSLEMCQRECMYATCSTMEGQTCAFSKQNAYVKQNTNKAMWKMTDRSVNRFRQSIYIINLPS